MQLKALALERQRASPISSIMIVTKNIIHLNKKEGKNNFYLTVHMAILCGFVFQIFFVNLSKIVSLFSR